MMKIQMAWSLAMDFYLFCLPKPPSINNEVNPPKDMPAGQPSRGSPSIQAIF